MFELVNWTVTGSSVDVIACPVAPFGQCVDLDGSTFPLDPNSMQTKSTFNIVAGQEYRLQFSFPTGANADAFSVLLGSEVIDSQVQNGYGFPYTFDQTFVAGSSDPAARLIFQNTGTINFLGPYLDNVTLWEIGPTAPVPEPGTLLLVGAGLAGAAGRRRTRRGQRP